MSCLRAHGKSQARKFPAAMAMPTPKSTPASTRFEPPSPNAKVSPDTTMATSESPRAMVVVKACCSTLAAFSQGELACARAVDTTSSVAGSAINARTGTARPNRENFTDICASRIQQQERNSTTASEVRYPPWHGSRAQAFGTTGAQLQNTDDPGRLLNIDADSLPIYLFS